MRKQVTICLVLAIAGFMLGGAAWAQAQWDSYAVKFACGNVFTELGALGVNGKYWTNVNIHNPHYLDDGAPIPAPVSVQLFKKIVLAPQQGDPTLPPTCMVEELVRADEAFSVNCSNIKAQLAISGLPSTGALDGFVVLLVPPFQGAFETSPPPLDVTALYTARFTGAPSRQTNGANTSDVETVQPKAVRGLPFLDLCLD